MKLFPTHHSIILDEDERSALDTLFDEMGARMVDASELIHLAIREGIKVLNREAEARRKNPDRSPTRSQVEARMNAEASQDADVSVENYECFPLEERLRRKLHTFLRDHPYMIPKEEVLALLLHLGIDRAEETASMREQVESLTTGKPARSTDGGVGKVDRGLIPLEDIKRAAHQRRVVRRAQLLSLVWPHHQ